MSLLPNSPFLFKQGIYTCIYWKTKYKSMNADDYDFHWTA